MHRATAILELSVATVVIIWVVGNDISGFGVADDAALIPAAVAFADAAQRTFT